MKIKKILVSQPAPENGKISAPPHPMVLEPPLMQKRDFAAGETLTCGMILFGDLNRNLPYFIYAFDQMGRIGLGKSLNGNRAGPAHQFSLDFHGSGLSLV